MGWPAYQGAGRCTGSTPRGSQEFMNWAVYDFGQGARNLGIYNCRSVRGSTNRSLHGEGRAVDVGFSGSGNPAGTRLLNLLLPHVGALGIQMIIWNRRMYSARYPRGVRYNGTVPHTDHLHIELTWHAARNLNRDYIRRVVGGRQAAPPPPPPPDWNAIRRWNAGLLLPKVQGIRTPLPTSNNYVEDIKLIQSALNVVQNAGLKVDGQFGPATFLNLAGFQQNLGKIGIKVNDPVGVLGDTTKWWLATNLQNIRDGK